MRCLLLRPARLGPILLTLFILALVLKNSARAQDKKAPDLPAPRLLVVTPAGGRAGTTVEITLAGQNLEDPQDLLISITGAKAEYLAPAVAPMIDPKKSKQPKGMAAVGPLTAVKFKIVLPEDAPLGIHDVRIITKHGLSNPRAFLVGDVAEVVEKEPNDDVAQAQKVALDSVVHGTIGAPTDVDYFIFNGKKDQRVVIACLASSIDSRAQPAVQLYRAGGTLLATGRDYQGSDAVLDATLPADGDYYLRVFAFTYIQGGPEHFYRLSISTAPWIDAIYPPMIEPGKTSEVTVYGRNLPGGTIDPEASIDGKPLEKLTVKVKGPAKAETLQRLRFSGFVPPRSAGLDGMEYRLANDSGKSNPFLLTYAKAPVVLDNEDNDTPEKAQEITLPCEIAGRIEKRRDRDWYTFAAKKGEVYTIEAQAEKIGSPLDLYFTLGKAGGKEGTEYDDNLDALHPQQFFSRSEDPAPLRWTVPEDGSYLLQVSSREADFQAGPRHLYRVRITPPQPDFRLIVMPASTNNPEAALLARNGAQVFTVLAWRQDGFNGEIRLSAEGLPDGVTCPEQILGPGLKQSPLVVMASADVEPWNGTFTVKGTATIDETEVVREARPATITWPAPPQQNIPVISRLDRSLVLAVRDAGPYRLVPATETITAAPGNKSPLVVKLTRGGDFKAPVQITLLGFPPNFIIFNNNQPLTIAADKLEGSAIIEVKSNVPPGKYTLVLRGVATVPLKEVAGKPKGNANVFIPATPVTLVVTRPQLGDVALTIAKAVWKPGLANDVVVKVKRKPGVTGKLKVELVLSDGVKGFSAGAMTIPDGVNEAKFPVKASSKAVAGTYNGLIIRVSTKAGDQTITQDAMFTAMVK